MPKLNTGVKWLLILALFCFIGGTGLTLAYPTFANSNSILKDSDEKDEDKNDKVDIPDNWDNPVYENKGFIELKNKFDSVTKNDTCYDYMVLRMDIISYEARYWRAIAKPGSDSATTMTKILSRLQELRLSVAKKRSTIENVNGNAEACVAGKKTTFLQDDDEYLKKKMRETAYLIDTQDGKDIDTKDAVARCAKKNSLMNKAKKQLANFEESLQAKISDGKLDEAYNAAEILKMAKENFAYANTLNEEYSKDLDDLKKMRICTGIIDESNMVLDLIAKAKEFSNEKSKDKSSTIDHLEAKVKMYIDILGDKRAYILNLKDSTDAAAKLDEMEAYLLNIESELAAIKYEDDYNEDALEIIENDFQELEKILEGYDEVLKDTEEDELSKGQKKAKANKLMKKARNHIKKLKSNVSKKDKKANTDEEEDKVKFVDQGAAYDANTSRKAAKAYKLQKSYDNALANAYSAIQIAKTGKELLKEVQ